MAIFRHMVHKIRLFNSVIDSNFKLLMMIAVLAFIIPLWGCFWGVGDLGVSPLSGENNKPLSYHPDETRVIVKC